MSSSWLLDIFGDSDLRSSTKLRHIGNVKSVIFIKEKQTNLSLSAALWTSLFCFLLGLQNTNSTASLCALICAVVLLLQKAGSSLPIQPLLLCISLWEQQFCLLQALCCRFQGSRAALTCPRPSLLQESWDSQPFLELLHKPKVPSFWSRICSTFHSVPSKLMQAAFFESMLIHRNSTNWEGFNPRGRGILGN